MATTRLKANQKQLLNRIGTDVTYQPFTDVGSNTDTRTGQVLDEAVAYPSSIKLKALIDYQPSHAIRQALGLKQDVVAILTILASECSDKNVTITTKDRFTLLNSDGPYYVTKIAPQQQSTDDFLTYLVAVIRKTGGKRNR